MSTREAGAALADLGVSRVALLRKVAAQRDIETLVSLLVAATPEERAGARIELASHDVVEALDLCAHSRMSPGVPAAAEFLVSLLPKQRMYAPQHVACKMLRVGLTRAVSLLVAGGHWEPRRQWMDDIYYWSVPAVRALVADADSRLREEIPFAATMAFAMRADFNGDGRAVVDALWTGMRAAERARALDRLFMPANGTGHMHLDLATRAARCSSALARWAWRFVLEHLPKPWSTTPVDEMVRSIAGGRTQPTQAACEALETVLQAGAPVSALSLLTANLPAFFSLEPPPVRRVLELLLTRTVEVPQPHRSRRDLEDIASQLPFPDLQPLVPRFGAWARRRALVVPLVRGASCASASASGGSVAFLAQAPRRVVRTVVQFL